MEYRMLYRDIPWQVAIAVLPGKIIGTFIIKPALWLRRIINKYRRAMWFIVLRTLFWLIVATLFCLGLFFAVGVAVGGDVPVFISNVWAWI